MDGDIFPILYNDLWDATSVVDDQNAQTFFIKWQYPPAFTFSSRNTLFFSQPWLIFITAYK